MLFSHQFVGVATTASVLKLSKKPLPQKQKNIVWTVGILSAVLPDFDLTLSVLDHAIRHRYLITHSIVPYIAIFALAYLFSYFKKNDFYKILTLVSFLGVLSHMILDTLMGGLTLLAPFTSNFYGFELNLCNGGNWVLNYIRSFYIVPEIIFTSLYVYIQSKEKSRIVTYLPLFLFFVAVIGSAFFSVVQGK